MPAANATLTEALTLLRGEWADLANNILHDKAVIWVGSGISRERFPPVKALLRLLLERLQQNHDARNPNCPYRAVTQEIAGLTTLTGLDLAQPPSSWEESKREDLLNQLANQYADVLQIPLSGVTRNSLAWDFLRLQEVYSEKGIKPDAEHGFIALLMAEGAVSEVVTTNWDPLIERGYAQLRCARSLEVIACSADLNRVGQGPLILKVHGCAEKMKNDPARYRSSMIATRDDINRWATLEYFQPFKEQVRTMLRAKPAVFIGISGQDFNLQSQWGQASIGGIMYPISPARIVFTTSIGSPQRAILQGIYGDLYASNRTEIDRRAALPLYAKPLLGALFVMLVLEKLQCLLNLADAEFPSDELRALARALPSKIELLLTERYDAMPGPLDRWRALATELPQLIARTLKLYRVQQMVSDSEVYEPIHLQDAVSMKVDPNLASAGLHWLLLAMALLTEGVRLRRWSLEPPQIPSGEDGQLRVCVTVGDYVEVFFANRSDSAQQLLEKSGAIMVGGGRRVLLIYPGGLQPARVRRSPARSLPGSTTPDDVSEIWLRDIADGAANLPELLDMLRSAIIAANRV